VKSLPINRSEYRLLCGLNLLLLAGLLTYAATLAFVWDEGFHVLAARLIHEGRMPYRDFCFPQTPLNAYFNAALVAVFGRHWQAPHVAAALFTSLGIFLAADFVYRRFPVDGWKLPAAMFASLVSVSIYTLVEFAPVGQAYGICLAGMMASYRLALRPSRLGLVFAAGLCAGIAAASSLLVAAGIVVLFVWVSGQGRRAWWKNAAGFAAGVAIPFAPVFSLYLKAPRQTLFNVVLYQAIYRHRNWNGVTRNDFEIILDLGKSPNALILLVLAAGGFLFIARSGWAKEIQAEYFLAAAIAAAMALELSFGRPTFARYFILAIPFVAIPAAAGFYAAGSRMTAKPWGALILLTCIFALSLADYLNGDWDELTWGDMEPVAEKVAEVTPPGSAVYADEVVYFLTGVPVPEGMQFGYARRLNLPASDEAFYHILSRAHLDDEVRAKKFATLETCEDDDVDRLHLDQLYQHRADVGECQVFWSVR
jgi:hypothetical protein